MKKIIIHILEFIGQLLSYIYPRRCSLMFSSVRDHIYTGYLKRNFAHMGDSVFMWHHLTMKGMEFIHIGNKCIFEGGLQLTALKENERTPQITIGNHCLFRYGCHITATNSISIGNNLLTGTNVFITDNSHGTTDSSELKLSPHDRMVTSKGPVFIGDNVWLGNNVCVLPGVTIGDGVVVGANSVVTHNLPPYSVAAGIPAKIIRQ